MIINYLLIYTYICICTVYVYMCVCGHCFYVIVCIVMGLWYGAQLLDLSFLRGTSPDD